MVIQSYVTIDSLILENKANALFFDNDYEDQKIESYKRHKRHPQHIVSESSFEKEVYENFTNPSLSDANVVYDKSKNDNNDDDEATTKKVMNPELEKLLKSINVFSDEEFRIVKSSDDETKINDTIKIKYETIMESTLTTKSQNNAASSGRFGRSLQSYQPIFGKK